MHQKLSSIYIVIALEEITYNSSDTIFVKAVRTDANTWDGCVCGIEFEICRGWSCW